MAATYLGRTCSYAGCERPHKAMGLCVGHFQQWRRRGVVGTLQLRGQYGRTCSVEGCEKPHCSRGYCAKHYGRFKAGLDPAAPTRFDHPPTCAVEGCNAPYEARGYCIYHHARWLLWGNAEEPSHRHRSDDPPTPHADYTPEAVASIMQRPNAYRPPTLRPDNAWRFRFGSYRPSIFCDGIPLPESAHERTAAD